MIRQRAYAKINLILNVLDKRDDGYHEVDFLMTSVDLYDFVTLEISDEDIVECESMPFLRMENNLAYKALKIIKEQFNIDECVKITIEKRIPVSAGMAGGSTDCAAVIRGLNQLFNLKLTYYQMAEIAKPLGSDVPFCIYSRLARARGTGTELEIIDKKLNDMYIVAINPNVGLSTKLVYKEHKITESHGDIEGFLNTDNFNDMTKYLHNDLTTTSKKLCSRIEEIIKFVEKKFDNKIIISGSGPTVLVFCEDKKSMFKVYNKVKYRYKKSYYAKVRN